jgi:4-hydroxybenzoate polyprenyltransferase
VKAPLRAASWWSYKIPPMLAVAYYAIASAPHPIGFSEVAFQLLLYIIAAVGIAGFGHLLLDAFDVTEDRINGKSNLWESLGPTRALSLLSALLAASLLPWMLLPLGAVGIALIGLQFLMFVLYAVPPFRLKERGFAGVIADAMYAHALPALWTWVPFSRLAGSRTQAWFPVLLGVWALLVGMRHLLQHQALDAESDKRAGTRTFGAMHGRDATLRLISRRIIPVEMVAFGLLLTIAASHIPLVGVLFVLYLGWQWFKVRFLWMSRLNMFGRIDDADRTVVVGTYVLSSFYERWLAPLVLMVLAWNDPSYLLLLLLHLILFRGSARSLAREDFPLAAAYMRSTTAERAVRRILQARP